MVLCLMIAMKSACGPPRPRRVMDPPRSSPSPRMNTSVPVKASLLILRTADGSTPAETTKAMALTLTMSSGVHLAWLLTRQTCVVTGPGLSQAVTMKGVTWFQHHFPQEKSLPGISVLPATYLPSQRCQPSQALSPLGMQHQDLDPTMLSPTLPINKGQAKWSKTLVKTASPMCLHSQDEE